MNAMEFEDMQKIWDKQTNEPLYVLNSQALHNRIESKRQKSNKITNVSELLSIVVNIGTGGMILTINQLRSSGNFYLTILALWMIVVGVIVLFVRTKRLSERGVYDRSILGDLSHALTTAKYQVRLSGLLRWNILPIGLLVVLGLWDKGGSLWIILGLMVFLALTGYASGWEHNYYRRREAELSGLYDKLRA